MYYYHTNDEIDEIGEGLIRKYNYQAFIQGDPTDIEGFIADHLNYRIVYDRLADKDAGRMAFLADGKDTMWVWRDGKRVEVIPPEGMIVIDEFLRQEKNKTRRRFVLAHEAGHIIMDLLNNKPVTAAYNGVPICSSPIGYYYAETKSEIKDTLAHLESRIKKIEKAKEGMEETLKTYDE